MEYIQSNYKIKACVESRIGGRNENQDSYGFVDTSVGFLAVVCDGMGGANGGKTASTIAVEVIKDYVLQSDDKASLQVVLSKAISEANKSIISYSQQNTELTGMGTTVTAVLINEDAVYVAHVGDSRIYQLRNCKKVYRTFDHSMVFELVKKKALTEEQARLSSQSNIITRALGTSKDVIVDTQQLSYRKNDRFILCTDGFHSVVNERDFVNTVGKSGEISIVLDDASEVFDNIGKSKGGGHDNLTAFIIEAQSHSPLERKKRIIKITSVIIVLLLLMLTTIYILLNFNVLKERLNIKQEDNGAFSIERQTESTQNPADSVESREIKNINQ